MKKYIYDNSRTKIGDIFYASWGYDQTNIDYYKVKKIIGKSSAIVVPIGQLIGHIKRVHRLVILPVESLIDDKSSNPYTDAVMPYPANEGKPFKCRIKYSYWSDFKKPTIKINSFCDAREWDGHPKEQTNINYQR